MLQGHSVTQELPKTFMGLSEVLPQDRERTSTQSRFEREVEKEKSFLILL